VPKKKKGGGEKKKKRGRVPGLPDLSKTQVPHQKKEEGWANQNDRRGKEGRISDGP